MKRSNSSSSTTTDNKHCSSSSFVSSLRFMVHAVDGAVPYMTPHLLQQCFPPDDVFSIGIAVRDTCIIPIFHATSKKARGYTFSSDTKVDPWLDTASADTSAAEAGYHRVTVPSFDLWQDVLDMNRNDEDPETQHQRQLSVTDKHVAVWTVSGRHVLTPEVYHKAAQSLDSNATVQLYDMFAPTQQPQQHKRRRLAALSRNEKWLNAAIDESSDSRLQQVWGAVLPLDAHKTENTSILPQKKKNVTGVVLVGWQHVQDVTVQTDSVRALIKEVQDTSSSNLTEIAVLSTNSLEQILQYAAAGCTLIGSHLPQTWARNKRAFLINVYAAANDAKRIRTAENHKSPADKTLEQLDSDGCFDLTPPSEDSDIKRQHIWATDTRPLLPGVCTCFTCQTHTRAYLYHLVCAKELLADMLLFIHNLHNMLELFREMKKARAENRTDTFIENIKGM